MFPSESTLSINSPFWKSSHIWRYPQINLQEELILPSFLGKVRIKKHDFHDIFDILVGKVNQ